MQASRPILMAERGIVVSGHHRASEAGAAVLRSGGNAFDAAVAAAAALAVAVPHMNGLGGDAIALCYVAQEDRVYAINGSGRTPARASVEAFRQRGLTEIPQRGPLPISVCGVVDAWSTVLERFGTMSLAEVLEPAIDLAAGGIPVDLVMRAFLASDDYAEIAASFPELARVYGSAGDRKLGERIVQGELAETLRTLAREGRSALYGGAVGRALIADLEAAGSLLSLDDLAQHETVIGPSLCGSYEGRRLHVAPPNSQGIALAYLAGLREAMGPRALSPAAYMHIKNIAFAVRDGCATDPGRIPHHALNMPDFSALLRNDVSTPAEWRAGGGDTSTLVVMDRMGNAVSWVQSLFEEFGSGIISRSTGIVMHNRMYLEEISDHPTKGLRPSTRPFHTLCPALLVGDGCELAIATPGDHGQPQAILQVMDNIYRRGMDLQGAIEAPRMRHDKGEEVMVESRIPQAWKDEIRSAGYAVRDVGPWSRLMGGVGAIQRSGGDQPLFGAADPRRAGYAVSE